MREINTMVEMANPTKYNDAQVPGAPDSLVDPALSIMRAINSHEFRFNYGGRVVYVLHKIT